MTDASDVHNAGLEPQPELTTEPPVLGAPVPADTEPLAAEDVMDMDVGVNVDHIPTAASNNTLLSTLDRMRLTPKSALLPLPITTRHLQRPHFRFRFPPSRQRRLC